MNHKSRIQIINNVNPIIGFGWCVNNVKHNRNVKLNSTVLSQYKSDV